MYICICRQVSDKTIQKHIREGADSRVRLSAELGVGTCCGQCMNVIDAMLEEHHQKAGADTLPTPAIFFPTQVA